MCKFFRVSRSGHYAILKRINVPDRDLPLAEKINECQEESHRTYSYRRVHIWLERQGIYRKSKQIKAFCIYQLSEICTITALLHSKWIKNKA